MERRPFVNGLIKKNDFFQLFFYRKYHRRSKHTADPNRLKKPTDKIFFFINENGKTVVCVCVVNREVGKSQASEKKNNVHQKK